MLNLSQWHRGMTENPVAKSMDEKNKMGKCDSRADGNGKKLERKKIMDIVRGAWALPLSVGREMGSE